ncbi:MAG: nucleotide exchange factor GrpE [Egibacteraceae bacterium]
MTDIRDGEAEAGTDTEVPAQPPDSLETVEPDAPAEPEDTRGIAELREALAQAERLGEDYLDQLRRARADYENLSRRKTRELMDALDRGAAQLVLRLLEVLDNFELALDSARGSEDEQLVKGVSMVHQGLLGALTQAGLEQVPGVGEPFDPTWHEALMQVDAEEPLDEPIVAEVLRTGYRFKGRILRPASVKVAR